MTFGATPPGHGAGQGLCLHLLLEFHHSCYGNRRSHSDLRLDLQAHRAVPAGVSPSPCSAERAKALRGPVAHSGSSALTAGSRYRPSSYHYCHWWWISIGVSSPCCTTHSWGHVLLTFKSAGSSRCFIEYLVTTEWFLLSSTCSLVFQQIFLGARRQQCGFLGTSAGWPVRI